MKYQQKGDHYFGFADLTISDVGKKCPAFFDGMSLFVTCLDSTTPVTALQKWMHTADKRNYAAECFDDGIWIPAEHVMRLLTEGFTFYGFDEVYLFTLKPIAKGVRKGVFTTDGYNFAEEVPALFLDGFLAMGATRYLSDGCGVNFVCESRSALRLIEGIAAPQTAKP